MTLRSLLFHHVLPVLTSDARLVPIDVHVYLQLLLHPLNSTRGHLQIIHMNESTFRRSIRRLATCHWIFMAPAQGKYGSMIPVPWMPEDVERTIAEMLERMQFDIGNKGEWLLKCVLDHVVDVPYAYDNVRPSWLRPGSSRGRLELDRWYAEAGVAIEFQGSQHYRKGETMNTTDEALADQIDRDNLKAAICMRNNVHLIEFTAADLMYPTILDKLDGTLPLIPISTSGPLYSTMTKLCDGYRVYMAGS